MDCSFFLGPSIVLYSMAKLITLTNVVVIAIPRTGGGTSGMKISFKAICIQSSINTRHVTSAFEKNL